MKTLHYPFCAVVGQPAFKQALILSAIDPKLGGVLVSGPRGMGKTTLARGLGTLLNESSERALTETRAFPFVTLPLGATEEKLVGSLDIEKVLADGQVAFSPGILARAHQGVLYVDEVNLLPDHLVDLLLDVAASGINHVERDGITREHPSRFILIGTMNPDEGELRPQLLDRFGLYVDINEPLTATERVEAVKRRLAFDDNPALFTQQFSAQQKQLHNELLSARSRLAEVTLAEQEQLAIAELCTDAATEGLRADITLQRAAKAEAAWHNSKQVTPSHINTVAEFVLAHRRQAPQPPTPPRGGKSPDDNNHDQSNGNSHFSGQGASLKQQSQHEGSWGSMIAEASATVRQKTIIKGSLAELEKRHQPAVYDGDKGNKVSGSSSMATGQQNQSQQARRIAWIPTLVQASNLHHLNPASDSATHSKKLTQLRYLKPQQAPGRLNLIVVDCSASTGNQQGLGLAKGVIAELSKQCYLAREQLAVVSFGNNQVTTLLHPQRAPKEITPLLDRITLGGGTPLRKALLHAKELLQKSSVRFPGRPQSLYLLTDGRSQESLDGIELGAEVTVIDTEQHAVRLQRCHTFASQLKGLYVHINELPDTLITTLSEANTPQQRQRAQ